MAYCTIAEVRAEGLVAADAADARVTATIALAGAYIDKMTGQFFEKTREVVKLDGNGTDVLQLPVPIVGGAIDDVIHTITVWDSSITVDVDNITLYNQSGRTKDDRNNPKIVFVGSTGTWLTSVWSRGDLNIEIDAEWGYVDWDGSVTWTTPVLIKDVCLALVMREYGLKTDAYFLGDKNAYRIKRESTRGREVEYEGLSDLNLTGNLTGDPAIDSVLASFRRAPRSSNVRKV